jgi:hypothetical protein
MAKHETVFVVVRKDWINTAGINQIVGHGRESNAEGDAHLIISDRGFDLSDHRGLWLNRVTTTVLTRDGSEIAMRFLIPWSAVLGLGIRDADASQNTVGFTGAAMTVLPD